MNQMLADNLQVSPLSPRLLPVILQSEEFKEMIDDVDDTTWKHRKHIAGIRKCFVHTILDLQKEHRLEGISDPKGLAVMAKRCTKHSAREAATRGKEMAKEALRHHTPRAEEKAQTLDILNSVLDMIGDVDGTKVRSKAKNNSDASIEPPRRLVSPAGNQKPVLALPPDVRLTAIN